MKFKVIKPRYHVLSNDRKFMTGGFSSLESAEEFRLELFRYFTAVVISGKSFPDSSFERSLLPNNNIIVEEDESGEEKIAEESTEPFPIGFRPIS